MHGPRRRLSHRATQIILRRRNQHEINMIGYQRLRPYRDITGPTPTAALALEANVIPLRKQLSPISCAL